MEGEPLIAGDVGRSSNRACRVVRDVALRQATEFFQVRVFEKAITVN